MPADTLTGLLADADAGATALVVGETGERVTYGALAAATARLAGVLAGLGVVRGSRVALVLPNGPDFVHLLLATTALGATACPLNPAYKRDEYAFYLEDIRPDLFVLPEGDIGAAREAAGAVRIADVRSRDEGPPALVAGGVEITTAAEAPPAGPDDTAILLHTSGTTSRPKQVPLLHRNLTASAHTIAAFYDLGPADVSYCAMPLFHVHGLVASTFATFASSGTVVVPRRFAPRPFWSQARAYGVTWYSAGPTLQTMLLERIDDEGAPRTLRFARSCSSALAPALMERLESVLGVPMLEAYGMTEASHQMASNPLPPRARKPGSVGVATGVEIGIFDAGGNPRSPGEAGEVCIRGAGVTPGYLENPEANAESFFDGWFRTGDRGSLDAEGYLRLDGRIKEMILRGGENISPYEVEAVLQAHPAVQDAVCFGVADEKYGELVGAAIVLSGQADAKELQTWCRERLANVKVPEHVWLLDAIPRTATGKVQRRRMHAMLQEAGH